MAVRALTTGRRGDPIMFDPAAFVALDLDRYDGNLSLVEARTEADRAARELVGA